jgi:hypothetical protein
MTTSSVKPHFTSMKQTVVCGFLYDTNIGQIGTVLEKILNKEKLITKFRIIGEQIDYEDELLELFIEHAGISNKKTSSSNYTVSMSFEDSITSTTCFLEKLATLFQAESIKYEFEYNEIVDDVEGEEYQLYHPDLL